MNSSETYEAMSFLRPVAGYDFDRMVFPSSVRFTVTGCLSRGHPVSLVISILTPLLPLSISLYLSPSLLMSPASSQSTTLFPVCLKATFMEAAKTTGADDYLDREDFDDLKNRLNSKLIADRPKVLKKIREAMRDKLSDVAKGIAVNTSNDPQETPGLGVNEVREEDCAIPYHYSDAAHFSGAVNERDAVAIHNVLGRHVLKKNRFSHSGFSDNIHVLQAVKRLYAEFLFLATMIRHREIGYFFFL